MPDILCFFSVWEKVAEPFNKFRTGLVKSDEADFFLLFYLSLLLKGNCKGFFLFIFNLNSSFYYFSDIPLLDRRGNKDEVVFWLSEKKNCKKSTRFLLSKAKKYVGMTDNCIDSSHFVPISGLRETIYLPLYCV